MSEHQPSPGDFNREDQPATSYGFVAFVTTYSRMTVTPEETDAMLDRAYGKGRHPGYEGRRWDRERTKFICEQCGGQLNRGFRFCSYDCWHQWQRENPPERPDPPTVEEMKAEMLARLDELRAYIEERE